MNHNTFTHKTSLRQKTLFLIILILVIIIGYFRLFDLPRVAQIINPAMQINSKYDNSKAPTENPEIAYWNTWVDPQERFLFKYPTGWKHSEIEGEGYHLAEMYTHTIGRVYEPIMLTGLSIDVAVYPEYKNMIFYDFITAYWCPDSVLEEELKHNCVSPREFHENIEGTKFTMVELLGFVPGGIGPGAWIQNKEFSVFLLAKNFRYDNLQERELLINILKSFKFLK